MAPAIALDAGRRDAVDTYIDDHSDELVELVRRWVRLNTVSVDLSPQSIHRENREGELQAMIAEHLTGLGARVDQWEPDPAEFARHPMMPEWHHWKNRPLTVGSFPGGGGGRSLIVNGHIDVVAEGDRSRWTDDPFSGELRDGRIYGRGSTDMKGGLAAALFAIAALRANEITLAGDLTFEAVTDEETCAMGTVAAIARGYKADAGLVPEPTSFDLVIATRGLLHGALTVPGRSAHAEVNQPGWREGGGVNAIEHAVPLLDALMRVKEQWHHSPAENHPLVGVPGVQPTVIQGGSFIANVPEAVMVQINATYLLCDADEDGYGSGPRQQIVDAVAAAADADDWLAAHPVTWSWFTDYPPSEIDPDEAILGVAAQAARDLGAAPSLVGIDSTTDGALLTRLGNTPSPAFGPGDIARAHAPNEWIAVDELVSAAKTYVRAITAWCGVAAK